ncbi:sigma-70 family RNA polymerase sigma factor [Actinophytocola sp.]|uniref:sigma-70 family RNA polymerase sigma factor n=1 Tax=Actinophytocola sp. TaxID=1872138 RepID=UPI002ED3ECFF
MNTATDPEPRTERAGFDALFDECFEPMKRLAFLLGADDPENIAQEAFVRLHSRWPTLVDQDKALAYLRRTVVNLSRSRLRHLRVVRRAPRERNRDAASAESLALANRAVWDVLTTLTRRQRQVLVLRYWLDLDQQAIADTLGLAVGTVKATIHQAMAALRTALAEEDDR